MAACTVNKSLQMILESDADWKTKTESRLKALEGALGKLGDHLSLPELLDYEMEDGATETPDLPSSSGLLLPASRVSPTEEKHMPSNFEIVMDDNAGPAAIPGSVVFPVIVYGVDAHRAEQDIITRGVVTVEQAQAYLDIYQNRLDHFLYRIMGDRKTLSEVRKASPLLLAAVCSVGALHLGAPDFEKCYQEFVTIAAAQSFSRRNTVEEVRGLCIGAFWLSGLEWQCIGAAVRIATDIQLHRSIFKALEGDRTHYLRTRLYYLVYMYVLPWRLCSVPYGRPPMTKQDDTIRAATAFLQTEHAVQDDARLISQVNLWSAQADVYDTFGIDVEKPLTADMIDRIRRFSIRLDEIRAYWTERLAHNRYVGNYPRKGVGLHYHFAKLYLYSLAFRGIGKPGFKAPEVALDIDELANSALLSATAILRAVVQDQEIQNFLNGLPTYFDIMIAFAVVFVLKVSTKFAASVAIDTSEIRSLVADLVHVLKDVTSNMHTRHLLTSVTRGAETLLERCCPPELRGPFPSNAHVTISQPVFDENLYNMSSHWTGTSTDNFMMGEFDFLSTQDVLNGFQPDLQYPIPRQV
ncbi:hypothetical protein LTS02_010562 [Friedmanniomyces endolithicus]|nr:hypothetical protein LTR94_019661 [Friedmanniomyces endolithicus]KAK0774784.1 hypothetical protein LTR38_016099 [Friedmanniomyces endolithicus]KAK0777408.1 hypothetical protein LTR75_015950 [Friedmanniomyces endolithicus]KAK0793746.1 hypothetical protein LTR59_008112 [Friedmanniomyces endolithicus]KAK0829653.1 hypothetical protein LTR03_016131 [Friedmanniomyces endolithicus]